MYTLSLHDALPISHGAHVGIGSLPIVYFGNEDQKSRYLPKLATGELLAAYALTEPSSGSDALGAKATAKLNEAGTHYEIGRASCRERVTNSEDTGAEKKKR